MSWPYSVLILEPPFPSLSDTVYFTEPLNRLGDVLACAPEATEQCADGGAADFKAVLKTPAPAHLLVLSRRNYSETVRKT